MSEQNKKSHFRARKDVITLIERQIRWLRSPKLTMASLVLIAGMIGFVVSALMLKLGVMSMAIRYAFALLAGYFTLGASLWLWTGLHPHRLAADLTAAEPYDRNEKPSKLNWTDALSVDFDEATVVILLIVGLFTAVFWFISSAPTLMAELTLDSLVSLQVYHRIRRSDAQPYLYTFWRSTRLPLFFMAIVIVGGAWVLQHFVPEAHTLWQVIL
jgi:hypothetical protein